MNVASRRDGSGPARAIICGFVGWALLKSWPEVSSGSVPDWQLYLFWFGVLIFILMVARLVADVSLLIGNVSRTWRALRPGRSVASGGWLSVKEARKAGFRHARGLFLGIMNGHPLLIDDFVHGVVLAPTRKGKTASFILPNLGRDIGTSRIVTDLRGDLVMQTAEMVRAQGQKVIILDPGGITGEPADSYNPLELIRESMKLAPQDTFSDARSLAFQLYPSSIKTASDPFWPQGTQKILMFGIVAVCALRKPEEANLPNLHTILSTDTAFELLLIQARNSQKFGGELASVAENILAVWRQVPKIFETFREGALQSLASFGVSGRFASSMYDCSFRFSDLKGQKSTLYLVVDGSRMETAAPYIGVMFWAALKEMVHAPNNIPVTFLLDEFTNYPLPQVPLALTALAAHGARLWMVAQEPKEIVRVYGHEALATILSQSDTKLFFGINSLETANIVSRMLGQQTVVAENFGMGANQGDPISVSLSHTAKPLMSEEELRRMPNDEAILITGNLRPAKVLKAGFHEIEPIRSTIKPNPFFGGKRHIGDLKMRLRGKRAKVLKAGRRKPEKSKQPLHRALLATGRYFVPGTGSIPLACVIAVAVGLGIPHLRVTYTFSGTYSHKTIHSCRFVGLPIIGQNFMRTGHENCPLVTWVKIGETP